jgi:small GTP-binding protein
MYKIVTAGEGAVGKTTFLHKYTTGNFVVDLKVTIGVEFFSKTLERDGKFYQIVIWDFGGQDQFRNLLKTYIKGTAGALFMIDLREVHRSLKNIEDWWNILNKDKDIPVILIGAKYDLIEQDSYKIQKTTIDEVLEKYSFIDYKETSSKSGLNIGSCLDELLNKLIESYP